MAVTAGASSTNFTITVQDANGNTTNTAQDTTFNLSSTSDGTVRFAPVSPVIVTNGTSSVTFTSTDALAGTPTATAARATGDAVGPETHNMTLG